MLKSFITNTRRTFASKVFVNGLPSEWGHSEIRARFSSVGPVTYVHLIKNSLGQNAGKAIITFEKDDAGDQAIARFDNQAVENLICKVRPYFEKEDDKPRKEAHMLNRRVYLMNVPYDATIGELEELVSKFAPVEQVVVPRDK